jgi:hypothetical protein
LLDPWNDGSRSACSREPSFDQTYDGSDVSLGHRSAVILAQEQRGTLAQRQVSQLDGLGHRSLRSLIALAVDCEPGLEVEEVKLARIDRNFDLLADPRLPRALEDPDDHRPALLRV